jgi:hypothetical protein
LTPIRTTLVSPIDGRSAQVTRHHLLWLLLFSNQLDFQASQVFAGMPSPLPTYWTQERGPESYGPTSLTPRGSHAARWQAISFFTACLLLSAWVFQWLWQTLRETAPWLPALDYRRSFSLVMLWGLLFVIVLTMISGARELMTPGAWRKQGWTYKLADASSSSIPPGDTAIERVNALKQLRLALWQHAATHQGHFPDRADPSIDPGLWDIPGYPGVRFISVSNQMADDTGHLLVIEPGIDGEQRQVLLTNGQITTMRTEEIRQLLTTEREP